MSVYVDEARWPFRGQFWCHLIADTHEELMSMARDLGLRPSWIQKPETHWEHFDLSLAMRQRAVELGAIQLSARELASRCLQRTGATE